MNAKLINIHSEMVNCIPPDTIFISTDRNYLPYYPFPTSALLHGVVRKHK